MSEEIVRIALEQREKRIQSQIAYQKRRYHTDSKFRAQKHEDQRDYLNKRYAEDTDFREKMKQKQRTAYAQKKKHAEKPKNANYENLTAPSVFEQYFSKAIPCV